MSSKSRECKHSDILKTQKERTKPYHSCSSESEDLWIENLEPKLSFRFPECVRYGGAHDH